MRNGTLDKFFLKSHLKTLWVMNHESQLLKRDVAADLMIRSFSFQHHENSPYQYVTDLTYSANSEDKERKSKDASESRCKKFKKTSLEPAMK